MDASQFASQWADPRGFPQAYVREGRGGVPLLLVHGWPETKRIWWRNVGALARAGFDVIAPDLRGYGESGLAPDGFGDVAAHSEDLYALVRDALGLERVVAVGGDLGGAVIQDLSLRYPGFVERMALFNAPLRFLEDRMQGLRTRPPAEVMDYFLRQGTDADALAAELDGPDARRRYVATFYTSRLWAHPGAFPPEAVDFHTEPFADGARLRASFAGYESTFDAARRSRAPLLGENPTHALLLFGSSDRVIFPDFDRMAAVTFPDHVGPFLLRDCGHFVQWEAAETLNGALRSFCGDLLAGADAAPAGVTACVALGSNLGDRERLLARAVAALRRTPGVRVEAVSAVYETDPVGPPGQGPYLNAAARLRCALPPRALLDRLLAIEAEQGRERGPERNAARTLDLDLLLYGDRVIDEPGLQVPHPRLAERAFALQPLSEVAGPLPHPGLRRSVEELAARVRDPAAVRRRDRLPVP